MSAPLHPLILALFLFFLLPGQATVEAQKPDPPAPADEPAAISAPLAHRLATAQDGVSFLIVLRAQLDARAALQAAGLQQAPRLQRATFLYQALTSQAQSTQADLRRWLEARQVPYRAHYLVNLIEVTGDAQLAHELRWRPEVAQLAANPAVSISPPTPQAPLTAIQRPVETLAAASLPYGLVVTHAEAVWAMGYQGQGIVVASADTGVEWTHDALKTRYRGWNAATQTASHTYHWYDPWGSSGRPTRCAASPEIPCDDHGHGTHTVGTLLGKTDANTYGMAPQAQWIGCRNMRLGFGSPSSYIDCFEYFLAPYPPGGDPLTQGRPDLAPHIVNNSWSCPASESCQADTLRPIVETLRAAGIMVVAAAGNSGPGCSSVAEPIAIYAAALSVGAHNGSGLITSFSGRGPVTVDGSNRLKPDLSAPGHQVLSTYVNQGYATLSGTSMASPHTAGAAALLWSALPALIGDIDRTEQLLLRSAAPVSSTQCGDPADAPANNVYGYGRLDLQAALILAQTPSAVTATVQGWTGLPVAGVAVTLTDQLTGHAFAQLTSTDGTTVFTPTFAGRYQLITHTAPATELALQAGVDADRLLQAPPPPPLPVLSASLLADPPTQPLHLSWPALTQHADGSPFETTHYALYRSGEPYGLPQPSTLWATTPQTVYTDTSPTAATPRFYTVVALDSSGRPGPGSQQVGRFDLPLFSAQ